MTVKELIHELEYMPEDSVVVCMDEHGGWDNIIQLKEFGDNIAIIFGGGSPFTDE